MEYEHMEHERMEYEKHQYILGHPIGHSKSPAMYNAVYTAAHLPWFYGSMDLEEEQQAFEFIQQADFLSINITTPYKPLALAAAHESNVAARLAGGANLLVNKGRSGDPYLCAYNVDGMGCISYLCREGVQFEGANAVVCGTGPTALSIMHAALDAGANVTLLGRDAKRAQALLNKYKETVLLDGLGYGANCGADKAAGNEMGGEARAVQTIAASAGSYPENSSVIRQADIILDATSLGMHEGDPAPFDTVLLSSNQLVFDTVYGHGETVLITAARATGARALDGRGMLVGQAIETLKIVTLAAGVELPFANNDIFEIMAQAAGFVF